MNEETRTLADLKDALDGDNASAGNTPNEASASVAEPVIDQFGRSYGTGRRKSSVARVWIKPGKGKMTVNGKLVTDYFARPTLQMHALAPFAIADRLNQYDGNMTAGGKMRKVTVKIKR
jgi:small subunit ribosomal protein S9